MSKPIEPGCIALVTNCICQPDENGKLVTVEHACPAGTAVVFEGRIAMRLDATWLCRSQGSHIAELQCPFGLFHSHCLKRIDDTPGDDESLRWAERVTS